MEALQNLVNHVPDWQRRLNNLNGQIERRQAELAALAGPEVSSTPSPRSLRNKGSSESLKPNDEGPMHPDVDASQVRIRIKRPAPPRTPSTPSKEGHTSPSPPSTESENRVMLHKHADEAVAAHARALAQCRKKRKSNSNGSADGAPLAYSTRSMIIVYYDSYVQGFFDDLVRFVSSSRNLMRKAKMAAKVAQIKRMAELEIANDAKRSSDERFAVDALPSLRYMSNRRLTPTAAREQKPTESRRFTGVDESADVYDILDKGLEFVQSTCEHGAHQFLRDADCYDEIRKIQARLSEVLHASEKELDRVRREDPELTRAIGDAGMRTLRRPSPARRDVLGEHKDDAAMEREHRVTLEVSTPILVATQSITALEVDPNLEDENLDELLPQMQYRSTRLMRSGAV